MRPQVKKIVLLSIVFSLVGIVILGASFYFLYVNGIEKNKEKLASVQNTLDQYRLMAAQVPAKQEELRQVRLRAQKAQQQIPVFDESEFDRFLWQLRNMARSTGVQIKPPRTTTRSGTPDPSDIVRATYELNVSGDFKRLWDFIKIVESSIRYVEIENYQFGKGKDAADKDSTTLTMRVSVFAYRAPAAAQADQKKPNEMEKFTELPPQ